jgi:group I intron endonuclease
MNIISGIYKITNPEGKIYIGQSSNIEKRWKTYKRLEDVKTQPKLYESLKKYGWENHKWEILESCNNDKNNKEEYYILLYNSYSLGLNSSNRSKGPSFQTNETRQKIGLKNKKPKPNSGGKGKPKPPRTKEHKQNISKSLKGYKQTEQHKLNKSKAMIGVKIPGKKVLQYDLEGNFIKEWETARQACLFFNPKDLNGISACCLGKQKTAFGYKWKYKIINK